MGLSNINPVNAIFFALCVLPLPSADHAALAGCDVLVRVEGHRRERPERAARAALVRVPDNFGGVLYDVDAPLRRHAQDRVHVTGEVVPAPACPTSAPGTGSLF